MTILLLIFIYIFYIGLGIPDSLLGTAWPAIYAEFHAPISYVSFVSMIISGGTVASSLLSARIIAKLGTPKVTALSTSLTAIALLGFSCSQNFLWLCLCAVPLGIGAGSIDTALNNYVAVNYNAMQMSFLHCFYGIGVSLSPYLMSLALSDNMNWRGGYRTVFFIQLCIALLSIVSLPLWKKAKQRQPGKEIRMKVLSPGEMLGNRRIFFAFSHICRYQCSGIRLPDLGKYVPGRYKGDGRRRRCQNDHLLFCGNGSWQIFFRSALSTL